MNKMVIALFLTTFCSFGQDITVIGRFGTRNVPTQHYIQTYQTWGKWIGPDVLYVDFGKNNYREFFVGGGRILYNNPKLLIVHEDYLGLTSGSASGAAKYVLPWTKAKYQITKKVGGDIVYFFYAPLNEKAKFHQSLERAKLEYDFGHFKVGGGYGGSKSYGKEWQTKPMFTATIKTKKFGSFEFWAQRIPGNHFQVQVRTVKTFKRTK